MRELDIAANWAGRIRLRWREAAGALNSVFESVTWALGWREDVRVWCFGLLAACNGPARAGRDPIPGVRYVSRLKSVSNAQSA